MQGNKYELSETAVIGIGGLRKVYELIENTSNVTAIKNGGKIKVKENGEVCCSSILFDRVWGIDRHFDRYYMLLYLDK